MLKFKSCVNILRTNINLFDCKGLDDGDGLTHDEEI